MVVGARSQSSPGLQAAAEVPGGGGEHARWPALQRAGLPGGGISGRARVGRSGCGKRLAKGGRYPPQSQGGLRSDLYFQKITEEQEGVPRAPGDCPAAASAPSVQVMLVFCGPVIRQT